MKRLAKIWKLVVLLLLAPLGFTGCETSGSGHVSGSVYYGTGFYDPWYHGVYYDDPDIIVTPPPRPVTPVRPPQVNPSPRPRPTPHIPMGARPSPRR